MLDFASLIIPAFIAGIFTFFAPCTLPLIPVYLAYISGASYEDLKESSTYSINRRRLLVNGLFYILGFTVIFILLGSVASWGGQWLSSSRFILQRIGGILLIFFGLFLLLGSHLRLPSFLQGLFKERRFSVKKLAPGKPLSSFLLGLIFALGWTPCLGPVLGSLLLLSSQTATVFQGAILLAIFSFGLGLPFLLSTVLFHSFFSWITRFQRFFRYFNMLTAVFLLIVGILLVSDQMIILSVFFDRIFLFFSV